MGHTGDYYYIQARGPYWENIGSRLVSARTSNCVTTGHILSPDVCLFIYSKLHEKNHLITNYLITESEVVTGKSQTEALPY